MNGARADDRRSGMPAPAQAAAFLKALAHASRLEILCLLADRDMTVGAIVDALGLSPSSASQQLMRLRAEGLVSATREGRSVTYRIERPEVRMVVTTLKSAFGRRPDRRDAG